jgi:DNA helicase HerA-like ATPase
VTTASPGSWVEVSTTFNAVTGAAHHIAVEGHSGSTGTFTLPVSAASAVSKKGVCVVKLAVLDSGAFHETTARFRPPRR